MITLKDIQDANKIIKKQIIKTPLTFSSVFSEKLNCKIFLKLENLQLTGAYKVRGALNKISHLSENEKKSGVIASSAGNHAQGVSLASKRLNIPATIVMPKSTPLSKVLGTKRYGGQVILHGDYYEQAYEYALELMEENNFTFLHPFNDPLVMAGQGTIGLEIHEEDPDLDMAIIPIGGGGLISGVATALKELNPKIKIIGVEAETLAAMKAAHEANKIVTVPSAKTIADGIAVRTVKELTFEQTKKYVDEIVTVSEADIAHAIVNLLEIEKVLVEGAGAVGLAALISRKVKGIQGKKVAIIISGGNIDLNFIDRIIDRGLAEEGRLWNFTIILPDVPGMISKISSLIAENEANILDIYHNRTFLNSQLNTTSVQFSVETKGEQHIKEIKNKLNQQNFKIL